MVKESALKGYTEITFNPLQLSSPKALRSLKVKGEK